MKMCCPLCRFRFDDRDGCHGCGFTKGCTLIKCPNCGYEYAERSRIASMVLRLAEKLKKKRPVKGEGK